jgi:hypothetical protein
MSFDEDILDFGEDPSKFFIEIARARPGWSQADVIAEWRDRVIRMPAELEAVLLYAALNFWYKLEDLERAQK